MILILEKSIVNVLLNRVIQQVQAALKVFPLRLKLSLGRKTSARSMLPPVRAGVLLEVSTEIQAIDSTGVES